MFCMPHFTFLLFTLLFVPTCCKRFERQTRAQSIRFFKAAACIMALFDPLYWVWEWRQFGALNFATTLPLYICSLFWMMLPIAVFARPGVLKRIALSNVCTVGLLGGILGLVFNVYLNQYPFFSFVPLRSLLYHFLMILVASLLWTTGYYRPQNRDWLLCLVPLGGLLLPSLILHRLYGWDYCYTGGGPGTPFEALSSRLPRPLFLLVLFGGMSLLIYVVFYRRQAMRPVKKLRPCAKVL